MAFVSSAPLAGRLPAELMLAHVRRGVLLWALVRLFLWGTLLIPPGSGVPPTSTLTVSSVAAALIVAATGVLAAIDARMMRELLFHALLGAPRWLPAAAAAATAAVMEIMLEVLL